MKVSKKIINLETESAFAILSKATNLIKEGKDIINLGIGQPDFTTPKNIQEAGIKAIRDGHHGYTPSNGILPLREAVSEQIHKDYNVNISPEQILITSECGFGHVPIEITRNKLKKLVEAAQILRKKY